ncbi:glycosyltransferase family 2 protein [Nitrosomonas europaea]|nr:glycosyltransferase family 2 protein [Nitrosomonas europaea]SDW92904.1 Glycosyltransferase involved in cell wall bisynthesis [Nitrosomonas europaea]SET46292.1 Glycosyltransferase involved in cell wall bisynthesis [Nitrosomonas europaea]SKA02573.1 Glycosyltransferase involved in cell wall bisynthesis [Nitrosomonas europaea]
MKISVVIPTFNRCHLLAEAINSALDQASSELEVEAVIVDDESDDGTAAWLETAFAGEHRVRVLVNGRGKRPAGARNTGILAARHPKVGVIFSRARYEQDETEVPYMDPNFECKLCYASIATEDKDAVVFDRSYFGHLLKYSCYFNLSAVVMTADAARQLMSESLHIAEDFKFWVRLSHEQIFACLKVPQIRYRSHSANIPFKADKDPAGNTPSMLHTYRLMLGYPGLARSNREQLRKHMAKEYFDWAYRCSRKGRLAEALRLRLALFDLLWKNVVACVKLPWIGLRYRADRVGSTEQ